MAAGMYSFSHILKFNVTEVPQESSSSSTEPELLIEVKARLMIMKKYGDDEEDVQFVYEGSFQVEEMFDCSLERLLSDGNGIVLEILNSMDVPLEPTMVENIASYAIRLATAMRSGDNSVSGMKLEIEAIVDRWPPIDRNNNVNNEEDQDRDREEVEEIEVGKVRIEGPGTDCPICLEELMVGSEAACMPCSHIFHRPCIQTWLNKDKRCPYCRFNLSPLSMN